MSGKDLEKAQVPFHDASAYFTEEEWKLLQEWQKELYRNVMKEIHQALVSLGPLIVTTVSSLRTKEKEELCPTDYQHSKRRERNNHSPSDLMYNPDVSFRLNKEKAVYLNSPLAYDGRDRKDYQSAGFPSLDTESCLGKEAEPARVFIDHLGAEIRESTDPNTGYEVVSFHIKDEEESFCMDHPAKEGAKITSTPTAGDGNLNRKYEVGESVNHTGKATPCSFSSDSAKVKSVSPDRPKVKMVHSCEKETNSRRQLWSDFNLNLGVEPTTQCESGFSDLTHTYIHQGTLNIQRSETYNDWGSDWGHANQFASLPNTQRNLSLYSCVECNKTFSKKEYLIRHKMTHLEVKPYQCTECEKSFRKKDNLFVHKRTHTGERPYQCAICEKSFNQKGVFNRHKRTHTGERPYKCNQCEKCFTQNGTLIAHQRTHNHPKK